MDGTRDFGCELDGRPMRVAVPHAPRDRRVGARQLLIDLERRHRFEVEAAIGFGHKDPEKTRSGQLLRQVVRQPPAVLDALALRQNARPERARGFEQRGAGNRIGHRSLRKSSADIRQISGGFEARITPVNGLGKGKSPSRRARGD